VANKSLNPPDRMAGVVRGVVWSLLIATATMAFSARGEGSPYSKFQMAFPNFDIAAACRNTGDVAQCLRLEGAAKQALLQIWGQLDPAKRSRCTSVGHSVGGSYIATLSCARHG
jgi:hypothetical protein